MTVDFLDTNILIYAFDLHPDALAKHAISRELLLDRPHISVQALTEFGAVRRPASAEILPLRLLRRSASC